MHLFLKKFIKKTICLYLSIIVISSIFIPANVSYSDSKKNYNKKISIYMFNDLIDTDVNPVIENGRVLVPLRILTSELNIDAKWIAAENKILIKDENPHANTNIELYVNNINAKVDGKNIMLDSAPKIINGRTMVPLRFISDAFDLDVKWISDESKVKIDIKPAILNGTVRIMSTKELCELQNIPINDNYYKNFINYSYTYAIFLLDEPSIAKNSFCADGFVYRNRKFSMALLGIATSDNENEIKKWKMYDGKKITIKTFLIFPSEGRLPCGEPYAYEVNIISTNF